MSVVNELRRVHSLACSGCAVDLVDNHSHLHAGAGYVVDMNKTVNMHDLSGRHDDKLR
jgi:hypothetical protein